VCLAHTIGELIGGDKSKTLCRRIYDTAFRGRWPDINPVNDRIAVLKKVHGGQGDYSTGCACSVAAFSEVVTNKGESEIFIRFNTNC
jgi:hypothetical protein